MPSPSDRQTHSLLTNASAPTAREIEAGITNAVEVFLAGALR